MTCSTLNINTNTRVRYYAITNNGKQKRLIADWHGHDNERILAERACSMAVCLSLRYSSAKVVCYEVLPDGIEKLIFKTCIGPQSQGMQAAI